MLTEAPIPVADAYFILDNDASNNAIGAVLSQYQWGQERAIAHYSRTLSPPEKQYCVTRKELLAVVQAVQHFHSYLYGCHFTIQTDHAASNGSSTLRTQKVNWPGGSRDYSGSMTLRSKD